MSIATVDVIVVADQPEVIGVADLTAIGLSYRQIDFWSTQGYLQTLGHRNPGSGRSRKRKWPAGEVDIAALMLRLIEAGLELRVAARVARDGRHELAPGIRLVIGGAEREEWKVEVDSGAGLYYFCSSEAAAKDYVRNIVKPYRLLRRTVHAGPWRPVEET